MRLSHGRKEIGIVLSLVAAFSFLVWRHARQASATFDETTHLASGYTYWITNDYRMNPEHPPLVKRLAAFPLLWMDTWPQELASPAGHSRADSDSFRRLKVDWASALSNPISAQWVFGHSMLYGVRRETYERLGVQDPKSLPTTGVFNPSDFLNNADMLLFRARMFGILPLGILLAVLVYAWARELFSIAGGVLALTLFSFDPNFIAHSGLVTTDVGITVFMFGAMYFLWRTLRNLAASNVVVLNLFLGLAFVTKYSAVLLIPLFILMGLARVFSSEPWTIFGRQQAMTRGRRALVFASLILGCAGATYLMIWGTYGFRYDAIADADDAVKNERRLLLTTRLADLGLLIEHSEDESHEAYLSRLVSRLSELDSSEAERLGVLFRNVPLDESIRSYETVLAGRGISFERSRGEDEDTYFAELLSRLARVDQETAARLKAVDGHLPLEASLGPAPGAIGRVLRAANRKRLFPEAYLYGFGHAYAQSRMQSSFLMGEYSDRGFPSYFLWTFLFKTPLLTIVAILVALFLVVLDAKIPLLSTTVFLVLPAGLYLLVSMYSGFNIGHRHLLPIYPFLFVLCGRLTVVWRQWTANTQVWSAVAVIAAIILSANVVFAPPWRPAIVYPHYLAYFNELAGGPRNGHEKLVDSNLDWGQDLIGLREWIARHRIPGDQPIWLCYFGTADPRYYQVPYNSAPKALGSYRFAPSAYDDLEAKGLYEQAVERFLSDIRPNQYLAISATNLRAVYSGGEKVREFLDRRIFSQATLIDQVGYSIFIYKMN